MHSTLRMPSQDFWNQRYDTPTYAYGEAPNVFFAHRLQSLKPGNLLSVCEGEGRNAIHAAQNGWQSVAIDFSDAARQKAHQLAKSKGTAIQYIVANCSQLGYPAHRYDAVALVYAHMSPEDQALLFPKLYNSLKPGGHFIFEAFSSKQLGLASGGPKQLDWLFTLQDLRTTWPDMHWVILEEAAVRLEEGSYHQGEAQVIRAFGQKPLS
ncbi:MAG: class I SAM-dependent methyltransferase [Salibacteraceae bacterium]